MFLKKVFILVIFVIFITVSLFCNKNYGLLDSARVLSLNDKISGGQIDLSEVFMCNFWDFYTPRHNIDVRPIFNKPDWLKYGILSIPSFSFYFFDSYGLQNGTEFSYKLNISTPSFNQYNIYGPSFLIDFGLKKSLLANKYLFITYKFSWAIGYNGYPGIDVGVKNMVLFTTNSEKIDFTFVPFLQNSLIFGIPIVEFNAPYLLQNSPIVSIEPGLELNWSVNVTEKFLFKVGLTTKYAVNFDIFQGTNAQGNFIMVLSFGWYGKYNPTKKKSIFDDLDMSELQ